MGTDVGIEQIAFYPRRRFKELKHCISDTGLVEAQNKSIKAILGGERKLSIENLLVALNDFGNTRAKSLTDSKSYFENENIREKSQKKKMTKLEKKIPFLHQLVPKHFKKNIKHQHLHLI